jgi:N-methylhydantoinase A
MTVAAAAHGIRQVANANMARAIRSVTIERGRDPRDYTLVAFGGSGPVHAVDVARALEIRRVLVPVSPGVFTALGMLASDLQHHFVRAHAARLSTMSFTAANKIIDEMERDARETLAAEGYADAACGFVFHADLRYAGQGSELSVSLPGGALDTGTVSALREAFKAAYTTTYGYATDEDLELVNFRLVATGFRAHRLDFRRVDVTVKPGTAARRLVTFDRNATAVDTPVVPREHVRALTGPAIVESYDSTLVVPPRCEVRTDACGNLVISIHD